MTNPNPTAAVIIIGNEILSGRTRDANLAYIGQRCDELGIRLREARVIPDEDQTIIDTVNLARATHDYVFTTGGIGPTHDDITSAAIARAFGVKLERNPEAVAMLEDYYPTGKVNEARLKMADIPQGAALIPNPVSGAPGIHIENVFVFPGVPLIMQAMFEQITDRLVGGLPVLTLSIRTSLAESLFAADLALVQQELPEVSIGSYPFFRESRPGVNLVCRSTDPGRLAKAERAIRLMIQKLGGEILNPEQ